MISFRQWLQHMWNDHVDELDGLGLHANYNLAEYFNRHKYWLRREYRHQQRNSNI